MQLKQFSLISDFVFPKLSSIYYFANINAIHVSIKLLK